MLLCEDFDVTMNYYLKWHCDSVVAIHGQPHLHMRACSEDMRACSEEMRTSAVALLTGLLD